jgi:hypothetical protein
VIRIAITQAAFEAIAATLALGSVAYEPTVDEGICAISGSRRAGLIG